MKEYVLYLILVFALLPAGCNSNLYKNVDKMYKKIAVPYVISVDKNSNAYISGLRQGDKIIAVNGKPIKSTADIYNLKLPSGNRVVDIECKRKFSSFNVSIMNGLSGLYFLKDKYPSTLGFAIYDIANAVNRKIPYDYAAAFAGDIFSPFVRGDKCAREWRNALGEQNLAFTGKAIGVNFKEIYSSPGEEDNRDSLKALFDGKADLIEELIIDKNVMLIHGGFEFPFTWHWGVADSISHDTLFAYTVGSGGRRIPVTHAPISIYSVRYTGVALSLDSINHHIIKNIVKLYENDKDLYGWKTGFEAYRVLESLDDYNKFRQCKLNECNYDKFWEMIKLDRRSENAFLYFSGLANRKNIKKYIEEIMRLNNKIISSRPPRFINQEGDMPISNYLSYIKTMAHIDSARIELYKKILLLY